VKAESVAALAIEMKLRHVPLLLVREMARLKTHREFVSRTLSQVIQRADELAEFVAIYWKDGKAPLSAQAKKGLAEAFRKFDDTSSLSTIAAGRFASATFCSLPRQAA